MENYAGSQWAKWDLHIHTTASDGKGTPEEVVNAAIDKGLSVIAITDHHTVRNVDEIKRIGNDRGLTVISGIEFRTEYGNKSVHMIGLFPDNHMNISLNQKALEELVLAPLGLSETAIIAKGKEDAPDISDESAFHKGMFLVQVDFKAAADLIHQYGGIVTVHAGAKSNSIEELKHQGNGTRNVSDVVDSLGPVKEELLKTYIDICELGGMGDKNARFYNDTFKKPAIIASDAHCIADVGKLFTWIKADKTFEGLKQIIYEPIMRVRIQDSHPERKSDYQVIESIEINGSDFGHQIIPFNPDLNTIIGGRSSGKSILLGSIAKLAGYSDEVKPGNDNYNSYINDIIDDMKLNWRDDTEGLSHKVDYFPQSYINQLALDSKETVDLIERILKADDERKKIFETTNNELSKTIFSISSEIENYFKLQYKKQELIVENSDLGDIRGVQKEIEKIILELSEVKEKSEIKLSEDDEKYFDGLKEEKSRLARENSKLDYATTVLSGLYDMEIMKDITADIVELPDALKDEFIKAYEDMKEQASSKWQELIAKKITETNSYIDKNENRIEAIVNDKKYIAGVRYYRENETIEQLTKRLDAEKNKENRLTEIIKNIDNIENEINKSRTGIFEKNKQYYVKSKELCDSICLEKDELKIVPILYFKTNVINDFVDSYLYAKNAKAKALYDIVVENAEGYVEAITEVFDSISKGELSLKSGRDSKQALNDLMTLNPWGIRYDVIYQGDTLSLMSEGKKAFVILRLLLDFDEHECPILIDQPEDDLDNRAIYNDLVTYIRDKKNERQIILVTHNPNVVVSTDSEEVIVANQHGLHTENSDEIKFEYCSGAIENSYRKRAEATILKRQGIREHICDLLEGGNIAFLKRERRYGLK